MGSMLPRGRLRPMPSTVPLVLATLVWDTLVLATAMPVLACCSCCCCYRTPCSCCSPCCQLRQRLPLCLSHHPRSCPCCHPCCRRCLRRCWTVCRQLCWSCPRCLRRFFGYFVLFDI